jgi:hypothetical protein
MLHIFYGLINIHDAVITSSFKLFSFTNSSFGNHPTAKFGESKVNSQVLQPIPSLTIVSSKQKQVQLHH